MSCTSSTPPTLTSGVPTLLHSTHQASFTSTSITNSASNGSAANGSLSRLCLGGEIVQVPTVIIQQESLFREVINKEAYRRLTVEAQTYLKRFLPKYIGSEKDEELILDTAFTDDPNLYFGNTLGKIHSKIRCGWFNPERPSDQVQLRDNRRVLYDHFIRHYYMSLLKKLLKSRHQLLKRYARLGASEELSQPYPDPSIVRKNKATMRLKARAALRARMMINEARKTVGEKAGLSSDEEDEPFSSKSLMPADGGSTLYAPGFPDLDLHQPIRVNDIKSMLREYKQRKEFEPDIPSMDISDISIESVYERTGLPRTVAKNLSVEVSEEMKKQFKK